jgi:hypothetical protein
MNSAEPGRPWRRLTGPARKGYRKALHRFMRISTVARSNFLHDPIAWTTTLAVRHRSTLSWFVLAGLLALVWFEPTRWGAVVTLWGILGAGLVVSLILEERSEGVEHRAWLRRNRDQIKPFLDFIHSRSALLAAPGPPPGWHCSDPPREHLGLDRPAGQRYLPDLPEGNRRLWSS